MESVYEMLKELREASASIADFNLLGATLDSFNDWYPQFHRVVTLFDFEKLANKKKVALLMMKLKNTTSVDFEIDEETIEYSVLVATIRNALWPINLRRRLFRTRQGPNESFEDFANRLKELSALCRLGYLQDSICRDIFVLNMHESYAEITKMIYLQLKDPNLNEAVVFAADTLSKMSSNVPKNREISSEHQVNWNRAFPVSELVHDFNYSTRATPSEQPVTVSPDREVDIKPAFGHEVQIIESHSMVEDPMNQVARGSSLSLSPIARCNKNNVVSLALSEKSDDGRDSGSQGQEIISGAGQRNMDKATPLWQAKIPIGLRVSVTVLYKADTGILYVCRTDDVDKVSEFAKVMNKLYASETNIRTRTMVHPRAGMSCVTFLEGSYHRARILKTDSNKRARVALFDHGSEHEVDVSNILWISKDLYSAPKYVFPIRVDCHTTDFEKGDILEITPKVEHSGILHCECERCNRSSPTRTAEHNTETGAVPSLPGDPSNNDLMPQRAGPIPFPTNEAVDAEILYKLPTGKLFAIPMNQMENFEIMLQALIDAVKVPLSRVKLGTRCLAPLLQGERTTGWYRAEITRTNKQGTKADVNFIDVGGLEARLPVSQLYVLPEEYVEQPSFSSEILLPDGVDVEVGRQLRVKASSCDESGALVVDNVPFASENVEAHEESSSRPPPPIPLGPTAVRVVYSGIEGTFVVPHEKLVLLSEITQKIEEVDWDEKTAIRRSALVVGDIYLAPFCGSYYRARLQSVDELGSRVEFIDFGNELQLPTENLRLLPPELVPYDTALTFKLPDTISAEDGSDLTLVPVLDEKGSWIIRLADDVGNAKPTSPQALLGESRDSVTASPLPCNMPLPRTPQLIPPFLPQDSFTRVRVLYVGTEGAFAVPVDKLEAVSTISEQVKGGPHYPLEKPPAVGQFCVAPFDGFFYRARVLSINQQNCRVVFVDFGNESELPIEHLRGIPLELDSNIYTFKITIDPASGVSLSEEYEAAVQPIKMNADGSCLVRINESP